ncbi:phosphatase inhibitor-domain-containing protein [Phyllosticta citribraziliensis]|uniref:Type 1 phosphatases regulator n=1 Tax=Phyllosticta citribraziliensis TaxID=989973 RepID=A0ABR1LB72_9PEZI
MSSTPNTSAMRTPESRPAGSTVITESGRSTPLTLPSGTLRLRPDTSQRRHIQWADDVIDNEGMGKKSSKVCCIYHKQREFGESSDESSDDSSSDNDSDSEPDNSTARPSRNNAGRGRPRHSHDHAEGSCGPKKGTTRTRKRSPNAYEKMPNYNKNKGSGN